jgi:outer membrane receptor for ferrienterochelin and colicin
MEEQLSFNWLHDQSLVTLLGVDVRERWVSAKQDFSNPLTGQYLGPTTGRLDDHSLLVAPYVQQTYTPARWIDLNAGARLDDDSRFSPVISPRGAVAFHPWNTAAWKVIYSQAFRAPTWSETELANHTVAPSDGVRPEKVRSVEASLEQRFGTQRLIFGVFRTWWEQLIQSTALSLDDQTRLVAEGRVPTAVGNQLLQYRNVANIDNYGWNGGYEGSIGAGHLRYGLNATAAFTKLNETGEGTLPAAPRFFGNARVSYGFDGYAPTPALSVFFMGPRDADRFRGNGQDLPRAPALADFRLTLTGSAGLPGLSYSASAEYITASHAPYTAGPQLVPTDFFGHTPPDPQLIPIDQYRVFFALRYEFLTGSSAAQGAVQ